MKKIIKIIINFIDLYRSKKKLKILNLKFYSDGPIKTLEQVEDIDLKRKIASEILNFTKHCDLFYKNISTNKNLKISGHWKYYLEEKRKDQIKAYEKADIDNIIILHENMFYNCLVKGLWSYSHFYELKKDHTALMFFLKDLDLYKIIFRDFSELPSFNKIKNWGFKNGNSKFNFIDVSSSSQKNLIVNSLNLLTEKNKFNILEIGGGFGSLAERMFENQKINSYTIIDVPSTLLIAYYYLSSKYGINSVEILNSPESINSKLNLKSKKIYLVPSAFFDKIKNFKEFDLLCNFASFSEMSSETVKYYLDNLPNSLRLIVTSNSNVKTIYDTPDNFKEILIDDFPIPKEFSLSFSTVQTPFYANYRYKTQIWFKKP